MSEEQLALYKDLHGKLTYRADKKGDADAAKALQELKTNRLEMLKKFVEDRSRGWLVNVARRSSHSSMASDDTEAECLNYRQMADWLKLDWRDPQDKALLDAELARYKKRDHPTWPDQYEYRRVLEKEVEKRVETDEFEFETMPVVDTAKAKAKAKAKLLCRLNGPMCSRSLEVRLPRTSRSWMLCSSRCVRRKLKPRQRRMQ